MLRVILVDDEPLARRGLRQLLAAHAGIAIVGEAARADAARELIAAERPDAVFLDRNLGG
jgi:two-component system LytT family response regulator